MPPGVKLRDLVKTARSKKYVMKGKKMIILPTWDKEAEIAYQVNHKLVDTLILLPHFEI